MPLSDPTSPSSPPGPFAGAAPSLADALAAYRAARAATATGSAFLALRRAAEGLHDALARGPVAPVARALPLVTGPVPAGLALGDAVRTLAPYVVVAHRALLVQYLEGGAPRTLLWNPTDVPRALRIHVFDAVRSGVGRLAVAATLRTFPGVESQIAVHGLTPDDVDVVAFDTLDAQYPSGVLARFPRARLAVTRVEWSRYADPPPDDRAFCIAGPEIDPARVAVVDEALALGDGVALVRTGGRREGHMALVVHGPSGVLVASGNAVSLDGYAPHASRMPGLARYALARGADFVPSFPTIGHAATEAMAIENALADRRPGAPVFPYVAPSVELVPSAIAPTVRPTARAAALEWGTVIRRTRA